MNTTVIRKETTNRRIGRVKTKKEMSRPNSGSSVPKDRWLIHSRTSCQRLAAAVPANRPITSGAAIITSFRSGSMLAR